MASCSGSSAPDAQLVSIETRWSKGEYLSALQILCDTSQLRQDRGSTALVELQRVVDAELGSSLHGGGGALEATGGLDAAAAHREGAFIDALRQFVVDESGAVDQRAGVLQGWTFDGGHEMRPRAGTKQDSKAQRKLMEDLAPFVRRVLGQLPADRAAELRKSEHRELFREILRMYRELGRPCSAAEAFMLQLDPRDYRLPFESLRKRLPKPLQCRAEGLSPGTDNASSSKQSASGASPPRRLTSHTASRTQTSAGRPKVAATGGRSGALPTAATEATPTLSHRPAKSSRKQSSTSRSSSRSSGRRASTTRQGASDSSPLVIAAVIAVAETSHSSRGPAIGTIEWARSNAAAIAAEQTARFSPRRYSPTRERSRVQLALATIEEDLRAEEDGDDATPQAIGSAKTVSPTATPLRSGTASAARKSPVSASNGDRSPTTSPTMERPMVKHQCRRKSFAVAGYDPDADVSSSANSDGTTNAHNEVGKMEELSDLATAPVVQIAPHQMLLLLRDYASRLSGGEGRALLAQVDTYPANGNPRSSTSPTPDGNAHDKISAPTATLIGAERKIQVGFDSVSHVILPWPVPIANGFEKLTSGSKLTPSQLAIEMRRMMIPGLGRYSVGQELVALVDGIWIDALVIQPPENGSSTVHRIQGGGSPHYLLLHPWNHAPQVMRIPMFNELWARHTTSLTAEHTSIIDAFSGQLFNVHHQCVPLGLMPAVESSSAPSSVSDVAELYAWLVAAQNERRDVASCLTRAARLVTFGSPDEASQRVDKELQDRQATMTGTRQSGEEALLRAQREVSSTRDAYMTSSEQLLHQQKLDMDEYTMKEKRREGDSKGMQQQDQDQLNAEKLKQTNELIAAHEEGTRAMETKHQQLIRDQLRAHETATRQCEQETDLELKAFREGQFKEADAFKRKAASKRIEEDKRLAQLTRKEQEDFAHARIRQIKDLEAKHEDEKNRIVEDREAEAASRAQQFQEQKEALVATHEASQSQLQAEHEQDKEDFAAAQVEALKKLEEDFEEQLRNLDETHKDQHLNNDKMKSDGKVRMGEGQAEERKQLAAKHEKELRKFEVEAEGKRQALTVKQDEERKAMFAARRQSASAEEKKRAEEEEKNKPTPQKERETLEKEIAKDKQKLLQQHEDEGAEMLRAQGEAGDKFLTSQESRTQKLIERQKTERHDTIEGHAVHVEKVKEEQAEAIVHQGERHEKEKADQMRSFAKAQDALDKKWNLDAESQQASKDDFRKKIAVRQTKEKEELVAHLDDDKKKLDTRLEDRRKVHAAALEEELNSFVSRQDEERSVIVTKQKADEKALIELQEEERRVQEESLEKEMAETELRYKAELSELESAHLQQQAALDAQNGLARSQLQGELQKAKAQFVAQQQAQRDQHMGEYRARLSKTIEHAQNELNHALLNKACILLTGAPAAGKTCLVSQLMMTALNDKQGTFLPIAIKVQQLQQALLQDRAELHALQQRQQVEREQLEARQKPERDAAMFDQIPIVEKRLKEERDRLTVEQSQHLHEVYRKSVFANSWNWVDAYLRGFHGVTSEEYIMQRQAIISRRALLLLDGIDEGGAARDDIERHVVEVLAKQGHAMVVTSRQQGLRLELFTEHFEHLELKPLTDAQQQQLIERRLISEKGRAEELLAYLRTRVPSDQTGLRMTGNPLMLSMIISLFENTDGGAMPDTLSALYAKASAAMLARTDSGDGTEIGPAASVPHLTSLLEAMFFRAHSAQRRLIEDQHVEAAALELGAPRVLSAIDWPIYRGRLRIGQVVRLLRGEHAGEYGVLTADTRGTLINGKEPKNPFKVTFPDGSSSGWVKSSDLESSGLDEATFEARYGGEGRQKAMRAAVEKLPKDLQDAVRAVRSRVVHGQLPLLTLLQAEPLLMQSSHLSFQEFYCAHAIHKGMLLPGEPPWKWTSWWANCLRLGVELGAGFGAGLMRAAGAKGTLNLSGQIGGHRPTSVAAVAELMKGLHTLDLSENSLGPDETTAIAKAISSSKTLTDLSLAKNAIGNMGAQAVAAALGESKLVSLNLFKTGIREDGAKAFVEVIKNASSLTKLNLQYNALRAESKRTLDVANATREIPIFLVT